MELAERVLVYKKIEDYRKKPLIVYATSTRPNVPAMMASDAVRQIIDQVDAVKAGEAVDVLIHSAGGDALTAWKLMSVLRERFHQVNVLVPFMAFSAATIFALGANEIIMHPHASLGPIDPQITVTLHDGSRREFSYEDLGAFLRFLGKEVGITEQVHSAPLVEKIFSAVDPLMVGAAKRASELSTSVGERLLRMHLTDTEGKEKARQIADNLNKSFFAHGDAVSRSRARELGLQIGKADPDLETLIWQAYLGLESYMELTKPFEPLQQFLANPNGSASLAPLPPLRVPANAPPQLVENMWNAIAQQSISKLAEPVAQVDYSLVHALIESARIASEFSSRGKISAARIVGGDIQVSVLTTEIGWRFSALA